MRTYQFVLFVTLALILSCEKAPEEVLVSSVSINQATAEMIIGETVQLSATVLPSSATEKNVIWSSSKQSVATISSSGLVTAIAEGNSTITASCGGKSATCLVTVSKSYIAVTSVTLNKTELTLEKGKSETLTATVNPSDATDKTVTWSSSTTSVASVDSNGRITAIAGGNTVITAKAGDQQATCNVTVLVPVESISLDKESITLEEESSTTLVATVKPDDATDKKVTWTSSDTQIATVDDTGKVTAIKEGSATITAKAGEKSTTCSVTVQKKVIAVTSITLNKVELSLEKGQSETLVATVKPDDATDKTVSWSTSNENIALVDKTGKISAISAGEAIITAKAGEKTATCSVSVLVPVTSITLNEESLTLQKGSSVTLIATVNPVEASDKTVTWSSSEPSVVSVSQEGKVTAITSGKAEIIAKAGEKSASCLITVITPVSSVILNIQNLTLQIGERETLVATVMPEDADDKTVSWSTSNANVATVDNNGTITALGLGKAIITAKAGSFSANCTVMVPENEATRFSKYFGLGWNMGNHFDAYYSGSWAGEKEGYPDETAWQGNKATQATFDGVKALGFTSVRIPISWLKMIGPAPDYKINDTWMNRVYEVVGFAHNAGLKVIINIHHDENHGVNNTYQWLDIKNAANNSELNAQIKAQIKAVWTQIAAKFANCGDDWLMMEGFNELNDGQWGWSDDFRKNPQKQCNILNEWNQVFVDAVRATGGSNTTRWLGVPSYCASPSFTKYMTLPYDSAKKIAISVHCYDPTDYTIGDAQYSDWGHTGAEGKKVTGDNEKQIRDVFEDLYTRYICQNIPVYLGEFGCSMRSKSNTRAWAFYKYYMEYFVKAARTYSLPCFLWDNGMEGYGKEYHGYINHGTGNPIGNSNEIIEILKRAWFTEAEGYTLDYVYATAPKF